MEIIRLKAFLPQPPQNGHIRNHLILMRSLKRCLADKHLLSLIVIDDLLMHLMIVCVNSPLERNILI